MKLPLSRLALLALPVMCGQRPVGDGLLARCHYDRRHATQSKLPGALREISGLALGRGGQLLAHNDEMARVYAVDPVTGAITAAWKLPGDPHGDFEGIALTADHLYLMTSGGDLLEIQVPGAPGTLGAAPIRTGLKRDCEFEGLAWDPAGKVLLLPCKVTSSAPKHVGLIIYRWDPASGKLAAPATILVARGELRRLTGQEEFAASSIEVDPRSGHFLVLSGRVPGVVEIDGAGAVIGYLELSHKLHPQPEGLTIGAEDQLYIGDEGGSGPGTLTTYRCQP